MAAIRSQQNSRRHEEHSTWINKMNTTTTQKNNGDGISNVPEPIRGNAGASVIGPRNPSREAENRDVILSPSTDHGTLGNLRWSFADSHMHLSPGGWGRQTTICVLPSSPEIGGVYLRLMHGGGGEM